MLCRRHVQQLKSDAILRKPAPIEQMQGGRIDQQKQREAAPRTIARQVANSRMAMLNFAFAFTTDVYSYTACNNFGQQNRANFCHRQRSRTIEPFLLGSRLTIYLSERNGLSTMPSS